MTVGNPSDFELLDRRYDPLADDLGGRQFLRGAGGDRIQCHARQERSNDDSRDAIHSWPRRIE